MEGNLSLKDAKAAIADPKLREHQDDVQQDSGGENSDWSRSTRRRRNILFASLFASGIWAGLFSAGVYWAQTQNLFTTFDLLSLTALVAAAGVPLCLIWIVALVLQRSDPLLERRLAIARTLQSTIAPVDAAEAKLDRLLERLRKDVVTVDQTVLLASERITALEDRFKEQVSDLFSATTEAEKKSSAIQDQLRSEREALTGLAGLLGEHLENMRAAMADATDNTIKAEMESRQRFLDAASTFDAQNKELSATSSKATRLLSDAMVALAERTTALDAAALGATQKLGKGVAALKAHEIDYRTFIEQFSHDFKAFDGAIDTRLIALEAAQNRLDKGSEKASAKLEELASKSASTVENALSRAKKSQVAIAENEISIARLADASVKNIETTNKTLEAQYGHLTELNDAVITQLDEAFAKLKEDQSQHSELVSETLAKEADRWEASLAGFISQLTNYSERAGTIAADRIERAGAEVSQGLETTSEAIAGRMTEAKASLDALQSQIELALKGQNDQIKGRSSALSDNLKSAREIGSELEAVLTSASSQLETLKSTSQDAFSGVKSDLTSQNEYLKTQIEDLTGKAEILASLPQTLAEPLTVLGEQSRDISEKISETFRNAVADNERTAKDLEAQAETVLSKQRETLAAIRADQEALLETLSSTQDAVSAIDEGAHNAAGALNNNVQAVEDLKSRMDDLESAAKTLSSLHLDILGSSEQELEERTQDIIEMMDGIREKVSDESRAITAHYRSMISDLDDVSEKAREKAQLTVSEITSSSDKAIDLARLKWAGLNTQKHREMVQHIEGFSKDIVAQVETMTRDLETRVSAFETRTRDALASVSSTAQESIRGSQQALEAALALQARVDKDTGQDLIRNSSLIVDGLNSSAVDLSKAFESDVTDAEWNRYLSGDKSIFTRRSALALSRSQKEAIRKRLKSDDDLNETVRRYLKDFELLMGRAMRGHEPTSLSIALVSSDLGKLYVALSQATRRMN